VKTPNNNNAIISIDWESYDDLNPALELQRIPSLERIIVNQ